MAETSSAGTVARVERYTPYGEPADLQLDAGPGFTGHATDVATGLTYMQQRYYDPEIHRFNSPDPVGPEEDFVNHFNRYSYALNNPVRYTDPDGRAPDKKPEPIYLNKDELPKQTSAGYFYDNGKYHSVGNYYDEELSPNSTNVRVKGEIRWFNEGDLPSALGDLVENVRTPRDLLKKTFLDAVTPDVRIGLQPYYEAKARQVYYRKTQYTSLDAVTLKRTPFPNDLYKTQEIKIEVDFTRIITKRLVIDIIWFWQQHDEE